MKVTRAATVVATVILIAGCGSRTISASTRGSDSAAKTQPPASSPSSPAPASPAAELQKPAVESPKTSTPRPTANEAGAATKAFIDRIREYVTFHNNVEKMVPPIVETAEPAKITAREQALGAALIKSRPNAQPGEFFIKEYQPYLAAIIKEDFSKRTVADRKALMQELPTGAVIGVNMVYPRMLPLATFPGNLLEKLPALPKELEYRIVGRHLILRDVTGNVIVDVMRDVFPIPTAARSPW